MRTAKIVAMTALLIGESGLARTPVLQHPFRPASAASNLDAAAESQYQMQFRSLDDNDARLVEAGMNPAFTARSKNFAPALRLMESDADQTAAQPIETSSYGFELNGIPVCDLEVKIHKGSDGLVTMMGDLPSMPKGAQTQAFVWASDAQLKSIITSTLSASRLSLDFAIESKERCLWNDDDLLKPVYKFIIRTGGLSYDLIADAEETFRFDPRAFHAEGVARVYPDNPLGSLQDIPLKEMDTTGYLANKYFQVCLTNTAGTRIHCPPTDASVPYTFAMENDLDFDYMPDEDRFIQTSVFAHTNMALEWLKSIGYTNFGEDRILLVPHAVFGNGEVNNAMYQPAGPTSPAMILVGDGDGQVLKNLGTDADVVNHELGHHVVYHSVTVIAGESLTLHEGLADFFTFSRTGDACLGESICTDSAASLQYSVCAVPKQCLRSGDNSIVYNSANYPPERAAHLRGQVVSGYLWDLTEKDGIDRAVVTSLVLKGIDLLVSNSGIKHMLVSLMLIDHSLYQSANCSKIVSRAQERGFGPLLTDITCENTVATSAQLQGTKVTKYIASENVPAATSSGSSSKKSKSSCGALGATGGSGQSAGLLLILSLPVIITWVRRRFL